MKRVPTKNINRLVFLLLLEAKITNLNGLERIVNPYIIYSFAKVIFFKPSSSFF